MTSSQDFAKSINSKKFKNNHFDNRVIRPRLSWKDGQLKPLFKKQGVRNDPFSPNPVERGYLSPVFEKVPYLSGVRVI